MKRFPEMPALLGVLGVRKRGALVALGFPNKHCPNSNCPRVYFTYQRLRQKPGLPGARQWWSKYDQPGGSGSAFQDERLVRNPSPGHSSCWAGLGGEVAEWVTVLTLS